MTFFKKFRFFAFLLVVFYAASTAVYADTLSGKIISIRSLESGQSEVVLSKDGKRQTLLMNSNTAVQSRIPAENLKAGVTIFLVARTHGGSGGGGGRGGYKGMKSPFRGIPKNMQKGMGLPSMPETPSVPGQPADTMNLPKVPKVPKVPKAPKKKDKEEAAVPEEPSGKKPSRQPVQPPVQEPTEEEKSLYGKVSSDKPLLKSTGEPSEPEKVAKKVLSVKPVESGMQVELEGPDGSKEQVTFAPGSHIFQAITSSGLRKNMQIKAEAVKTNKVNIAQKITVVS